MIQNTAAIIVYLPNGDWAIQRKQRNKRSVFKEVINKWIGINFIYTVYKNEGKSCAIKWIACLSKTS